MRREVEEWNIVERKGSGSAKKGSGSKYKVVGNQHNGSGGAVSSRERGKDSSASSKLKPAAPSNGFVAIDAAATPAASSVVQSAGIISKNENNEKIESSKAHQSADSKAHQSFTEQSSKAAARRRKEHRHKVHKFVKSIIFDDILSSVDDETERRRKEAVRAEIQKNTLANMEKKNRKEKERRERERTTNKQAKPSSRGKEKEKKEKKERKERRERTEKDGKGKHCKQSKQSKKSEEFEDVGGAVSLASSSAVTATDSDIGDAGSSGNQFVSADVSDVASSLGDGSFHMMGSLVGRKAISGSDVSNANGHTNCSQKPVDWKLLSTCLSRDVKRFMSKRAIALTERRKARAKILAAVNAITEKEFTYMEAILFGSCATGLDLPSSDLDVVIKSISHKKHGKRNVCQNEAKIQQLAEKLIEKQWAFQVKPILTANVPVIKFLADPMMIIDKEEGRKGNEER